MKLNQLLDNIRYGEVVVEQMTDKDFTLSNLHEDFNELIVSKQLEGYLEPLLEGNTDNIVIEKFNKIKEKFKDIEERKEDGKPMSEIYVNMKFDSIYEDYNKIVDALQDRKTYKLFDVKMLSKAMATTIYGLGTLTERGVKQTNNALLNTYIKENLEFLNDILE